MKDIIDHTGSVESIEGTHVRIRILQSSACSACQAKSLCASAEQKEKIVDVWDDEADRLTVGDEVRVCASMSMGRNAVVLAFVVPLVLMVVWLVVALRVLSMGELAAIGGVLLLLLIYYIGLWAVRNRLSRAFAFWIEK
jgi:sigma-E factor negative regulatory protein RseC